MSPVSATGTSRPVSCAFLTSPGVPQCLVTLTLVDETAVVDVLDVPSLERVACLPVTQVFPDLPPKFPFHFAALSASHGSLLISGPAKAGDFGNIAVAEACDAALEKLGLPLNG
jgi:hypothetical protein